MEAATLSCRKKHLFTTPMVAAGPLLEICSMATALLLRAAIWKIPLVWTTSMYLV